eukprot:2788296-Rhodomonas_salina.1
MSYALASSKPVVSVDPANAPAWMVLNEVVPRANTRVVNGFRYASSMLVLGLPANNTAGVRLSFVVTAPQSATARRAQCGEGKTEYRVVEQSSNKTICNCSGAGLMMSHAGLIMGYARLMTRHDQECVTLHSDASEFIETAARHTAFYRANFALLHRLSNSFSPLAHALTSTLAWPHTQPAHCGSSAACGSIKRGGVWMVAEFQPTKLPCEPLKPVAKVGYLFTPKGAKEVCSRPVQIPRLTELGDIAPRIRRQTDTGDIRQNSAIQCRPTTPRQTELKSHQIELDQTGTSRRHQTELGHTSHIHGVQYRSRPHRSYNLQTNVGHVALTDACQHIPGGSSDDGNGVGGRGNRGHQCRGLLRGRGHRHSHQHGLNPTSYGTCTWPYQCRATPRNQIQETAFL